MSEYLYLYGFYFIPYTFISCLTFLFSFKKCKWQLTQVLLFFVPFLLWLFLAKLNIVSKSLSNIVELIYCAILISIFGIYSSFSKRVQDKDKPYVDLGAAAIIILLVYFLVPGLPE